MIVEDQPSLSNENTPEEKVISKRAVEPINLFDHDERNSSPSLPLLACEIECVQLLSVNVGTGAFCEISQVIWYGSYCAGKRINLFRVSPRAGDTDEAFLDYCERAMTLRHPNLVEFYGVFRPRTCPILVTELMHCSLRHRINAVAYPTLTFIEKCNIAYSTICALTYLHSINPPLSHGNLTPDNILLDQQLRTKVSDAGLARTLSQNHSNMLECYKHVGILAYMPPEVDRDCSTATDVFSFGVVFLEMLCEMYPQPVADPVMPDPEAQNAATDRPQNEIERRRMYLNLIQDRPFCSEIIQHCLSDEPEQRPLADFIANIFRNKGHEWKNNIPGNSAKIEMPHSFIFPPPSDQMRGSETMTPTEKLMLGNLLNSPSPAEASKSVSAMWNEANKHGELMDPQSKLYSNPLPGPSYYTPAGFPPFQIPQRNNFGPFMGPHIPIPFPSVPQYNFNARKTRIAPLQPVPEVLSSYVPDMEALRLEGPGEMYIERLESSLQLEPLSTDHVALPQKIDRCEVISCDKILFLYDLQEGYTYAYDTMTQKWTEVPQCPRVGAAPVLYNNQLVVLGGKKDPSSTFIGKELFALDYDPLHSSWCQKYASMLRHRRFAVAFSYREFIVVIGGDSGLNSVEVYNGSKDAWSRAANFIETSRFVDSAVVIHDHVYVLLSAQTKQTLNKYSVVYWANLSLLSEGSDDLVWFLLDDKIAQPSYALAKWDNFLFAVTCVRQSYSELLVYDMERHRWTYLCSLKIRHTLCGTGVLQTGHASAQIFILGGNNREGVGDLVSVKCII